MKLRDFVIIAISLHFPHLDGLWDQCMPSMQDLSDCPSGFNHSRE